jgi:hypothetical protein
MIQGRENGRRQRRRVGSSLTLMGWGAVALSALLLALITVATVKGYY